MKIEHHGDYASRRAAEYPTLEEQLDAFWKGGEHERAMREKFLSVKSKYPKPKS